MKQKRPRSKIIFLFKQSKDGKPSASKVVKEFLDASRERHVNASCLNSCVMHEALKRVFIKMNTVVPSSAAVERVFSIEKDILKLKRSGLSDIRRDGAVSDTMV